MKSHEFTIVASGLDPLTGNYEDRFFEAGCDDATLSFQMGRNMLQFAREAETREAAISSQTAGVDVLP